MCVAFLPMTIVSDPEAEELPSRHRNVDTEEFVLIRKMSGRPVNQVLHAPQAVTHGPTDRAAFEAIRKPGMTRPLDGISIDSYKRLQRSPQFLAAIAPAVS